MRHFNILIGGSAGQGIDTLSSSIEKTLHKMGYYIFSNKDYESRVRGGHNFTQVRFGNLPVYSHSDSLDMIIALNEEAIEVHKDKLSEGGIILCDESITSARDKVVPLPLNRTAKQIGNAMVANTVAFGAVCKLVGFDIEIAKDIINASFGEEYAGVNLKAFDEGCGMLQSRFNLEEPSAKNQMLINSNQAIALGALAGGVMFYAAYPMTPSTGILTYLAAKTMETDLIVEQAEDEIAAIQMALGASYAGVRAMTGTSGGGFALMVETLSLAGMIETPIVIVDSQRPGPATGFPTRTEQGDLSFVLNAGHGEFSRMVISVRSPEDAFYQTVRALNLADEFQIPVIILTDQYLADSNQTVDKFDMSRVKIERHISDFTLLAEYGDYGRYRLTETGLSPRIIPGKNENQTVLVDSDEHDELGHIVEDADTRIKMVNKRLGKAVLLKKKVMEPDYYGTDSPEILLIGWGSTEGALREAVEILNDQGGRSGALVFGDIWPLPTGMFEKYSKDAKTVVNIEQNATGQLGKLIRQETGFLIERSILKYDGRQINAKEIVRRLNEEVL